MLEVEYDCDAWIRYPEHRWVFNKLEVALRLGYNAGPSGVSVPNNGDYVVRPTYNLSGMGVNARRIQLTRGDYSTVKPGEFWCEYFHGPNITVDYKWDTVDGNTVLRPVFAAQGHRAGLGLELYRFTEWRRISAPFFQLPTWINEFQNVPRFNIEFIHDRIIEIHLRSGVDFPHGADHLIPIWSDTPDSEYDRLFKLGYKYKDDIDDADGHLPVSRLGFFYK